MKVQYDFNKLKVKLRVHGDYWGKGSMHACVAFKDYEVKAKHAMIDKQLWHYDQEKEEEEKSFFYLLHKNY